MYAAKSSKINNDTTLLKHNPVSDEMIPYSAANCLKRRLPLHNKSIRYEYVVVWISYI